MLVSRVATMFIFIDIPPSTNTNETLCELYGAISKLQNSHPDQLFIVAGDFNQAHLKSVLPKFHQYVDFQTIWANVLDIVYTNITGEYQAEPHPYLSYLYNLTVMLMPAYRQLIKCTNAVLKQVKNLCYSGFF